MPKNLDLKLQILEADASRKQNLCEGGREIKRVTSPKHREGDRERNRVTFLTPNFGFRALKTSARSLATETESQILKVEI